MDSGPSTSLKTRPEVEYPTSWKNLVDAQFEENHVEIGLEALSNFIAPGFAPSISHVLILMHLTLQDVPKTSSSEVQQSLLPKTSSSLPLPQTALILLHRLLSTNSPHILARSIPNCDFKPTSFVDSGASKLENEGQKMLRWKDFWEGPERVEGKARPKAEGVEEEERLRREDAKSRDRWWTLAEWAVDLWEKDLENVWAWMPGTSKGAPVPLLLSQILPTNSDDPLAQRWELYRPLAVILSAFANAPPLKSEDKKAHEPTGWMLSKEEEEKDGADWGLRRRIALRLLDLFFVLATPCVAHPNPLLSPTRLVELVSSKLGQLSTPALLLIFSLTTTSPPSPTFISHVKSLKIQILGSVIVGQSLTNPPNPATLDQVVLTKGSRTVRNALLKLVLFQLVAQLVPTEMGAGAPWRGKMLAGTRVDERFGASEGMGLVRELVDGVVGE